MRHFRGSRYANVTSTLALVVALGGTGAYAATSIRSADIKNGQVKNVDLAANAVTSGKVRNGSLVAKDFKAGELPKGATGAAGTQGAGGKNGANGANGPAGAAGAVGPAGPAGPSASSSGDEPSLQTIGSQANAAVGVASTDITLAVRSRIAATATMTAQPANVPGTTFQLTCRIELSTPSFGNIETIGLSRNLTATSANGTQATLALTGLGVRDPGTYRLVVRCFSSSSPTARVSGASILAVATADAG